MSAAVLPLNLPPSSLVPDLGAHQTLSGSSSRAGSAVPDPPGSIHHWVLPAGPSVLSPWRAGQSWSEQPLSLTLRPASGQVCKKLSLEERRGTKGRSVPWGHQL